MDKQRVLFEFIALKGKLWQGERADGTYAGRKFVKKGRAELQNLNVASIWMLC